MIDVEVPNLWQEGRSRRWHVRPEAVQEELMAYGANHAELYAKAWYVIRVLTAFITQTPLANYTRSLP